MPNEMERAVPEPSAKTQTSPQDHPYVEVFTEIEVIEHHLRAAVTRNLPSGMTYAHFELLRYAIRYGDGQTPAQLAKILLLTKGAMTNVLQKMEALGYVVILADVADRRKKRVRITRDGIAARLHEEYQ